MIDLHNHILPGVDDGASDMDESLAIARRFAAEGVTRVAATPHLDPEHDRGIHADEVRRLVVLISGAIHDRGISLMIEPGQEIYLTPAVPSLLASGVAIPLGAGRTVLVELSLTAQGRLSHLDDTVAQLWDDGYQIVLAHPERYAFVQEDPTALDGLIEQGLVLQLTAPSLLGHNGRHVRNVAMRLLHRGSYLLGSSDRHHPDQPRSMADLHQEITRLTDEDTADLLLRVNPERVLEGSDLLRPAVKLDENPSVVGPPFDHI